MSPTSLSLVYKAAFYAASIAGSRELQWDISIRHVTPISSQDTSTITQSVDTASSNTDMQNPAYYPLNFTLAGNDNKY